MKLQNGLRNFPNSTSAATNIYSSSMSALVKMLRVHLMRHHLSFYLSLTSLASSWLSAMEHRLPSWANCQLRACYISWKANHQHKPHFNIRNSMDSLIVAKPI
mmetsp:Transcript_49460/g.106557  ORF Transcript_49460/g.106557 Transcript_49460/m.106557 type:complete len:103 (-) Transcript_49460:189-497(-)